MGRGWGVMGRGWGVMWERVGSDGGEGRSEGERKQMTAAMDLK